MPNIKKLSQSLVNKIAAGEVIERPASVVKELVENSVDAGAKRIEVTINKAGSELIKVTDNGCGIAADQLELALTPHATSKIEGTDDLFSIHTFGFRGEALASMAEVSQMIIRSCAEGADAGAEIRVEGGERSEPVPCGIPTGTTIEIRKLFFNTPVRRKFLKGQVTEFGHISEAVARLALPNFNVHFILKHNGRTVYDLPPTNDFKDRIGRIFGTDLAEKLIPIDSEQEGIRIRGFVGLPDLSRSNASLQYFFLNNRFIRDRSLQHALTQAYRGLLTVGRYPVAFLQIEMAPEDVDVNVHPTKMEVRFLESNRIYSAFLNSIRQEFLRHDLKSRPQTPSQENQGNAPDESLSETPQNSLSADSDLFRSQVLDWMRQDNVSNNKDASSVSGENSSLPSNAPIDGYAEFDREGPNALKMAAFPSESRFPSANQRSSFRLPGESVPAFKPFEDSNSFGSHSRGNVSSESRQRLSFNSHPSPDKTDFSPEIDSSASSSMAETFHSEVPSNIETAPPIHLSQIAYAPNGQPVLQIQDRFLVFETEEGMALIDQHALHERILYEKLKRAMETEGRLESQRLLIPATIDLSPNEAACALDNQKTLSDFGLAVESFGGNTLLISAYPTLLKDLPPNEIFILLLGILMRGGKENLEREEIINQMIAQSACKAAVKGGDRLRSDAISELLALGEEEIHSHHCPHGRPSILIFSIEELNKMFKRT